MKKRAPSIGQRIARAVDTTLGARALARRIGAAGATAAILRSWIMTIPYVGAYSSTDPQRRMLEGWNPRLATADQSLAWNLTQIIAQCRQIERTNAQARGMVDGFVADIVGTGIGIEPDTGDEKLNKILRDDWEAWVENCTPEGMTLWELQRQAGREWCTGGAHLWREITIPSRAKDGLVPLAFVPLEVEWLTFYPVANIAPANSFVRGVELDQLGRPVNFHLMDYNLLNQLGLGAAWGGPGFAVPASEIIHGFEKKRPRQTHGEPILAIGIERTKNDELLMDIEIATARTTSAPAIAITADYHDNQVDEEGLPVTDINMGSTFRLAAGEKAELLANPRPNEKLDPFRKGIRGDLAAGWGSTRQYLERDPSTANYSSMTNDRNLTDLLRGPIQVAFARTAASEPYNRFVPWCLLRNGIALPVDPIKRRAFFRHKVLYPARPYVDAEKDSKASKFMIDSGLSTREQECAAQGKDYARVQAQLAREDHDIDMRTIARIKAIQAAAPDLPWQDVIAASVPASLPSLLTANAQVTAAATPKPQEASDAA